MSPKLLELQTSNLVGGFVLGMPSRRTRNFPESGRGLGDVTPAIFGSTVGYPSDSLASCYRSPPHVPSGLGLVSKDIQSILSKSSSCDVVRYNAVPGLYSTAEVDRRG